MSKASVLFILPLLLSYQARSEDKACEQEDIDHYLAVHNCMIESSSEDCMQLSLRPGGVLGFAAGFGGGLFLKKRPGMLEGLRKIEALNQDLPELRRKYFEYRKQAQAELNDMRLKAIDKLLNEMRDFPYYSSHIRNLRNHPDSELPYYLEDMSLKDKVTRALKDYHDAIDESVGKKIKSGGFKISKEFSSKDLGSMFRYGVPKSFLDVPNVNLKYFPKEFMEHVDLQKHARATVKKSLLKDPDAKKIYEKNNFSDPAYRDLESRIIFETKATMKVLVEKGSPNLQFYHMLNENHFNDVPLQEFAKRAPTPKGNLRVRMAKATAMGAVGAAVTEASLNIRAKAELANCRNFFDLSDEELAFLNNESILLAGSHVRSDLVFNNCDTMYLSDPEKTISEAIKKFDKIPPGLCKIMRKEVKRLTKSMEETMQNSSPDCSTRSFTTDSVAVKPMKQGHSEAQITLKKGDNTFIYEAPIVKDTNFPDFRFVKVYRMKNGEKNLDDLLTMDFLKLYNNLKPNENFDQLMTPEKMFENDEQRKTFKKIRDRKYNAIMTQFYRSYVEACKAYNKPECEVMERGLNIAPFMANMKTVCGEEELEKGSPEQRKDRSSSQQ